VYRIDVCAERSLDHSPPWTMLSGHDGVRRRGGSPDGLTSFGLSCQFSCDHWRMDDGARATLERAKAVTKRKAANEAEGR